MIEQAKNMSLFLIISIFVNWISNAIESNFIATFLSDELITLLIALVAINTTTLGVVLTKVKDISDDYTWDFSGTIKEMKLSIHEQIFLIISAIIIQIVQNSEIIKTDSPAILFITQVVLIAIFFYFIYILYDTANSIFVILDFENKNNKSK
jgi:hypothetical protein